MTLPSARGRRRPSRTGASWPPTPPTSTAKQCATTPRYVCASMHARSHSLSIHHASLHSCAATAAIFNSTTTFISIVSWSLRSRSLQSNTQQLGHITHVTHCFLRPPPPARRMSLHCHRAHCSPTNTRRALTSQSQGCAAYIFAPKDCDGQSGPVCWVKGSVSGKGVQRSCRNSRVMGQAAASGTDIPTRWADQVSASTTPLPAYPRPQMVRGTVAGATKDARAADHESARRHLRDHGDASQWTNLNGLWEWEPSTAAGIESPPFGRTLNSSILGKSHTSP